MKQHKPTQKAVVVFRQWQRKNYALFQVLGRQIRIAVLAAIYFLVTKPMDAQVLVQADSSIYDYELEEVEVKGQRLGISALEVPRLLTLVSQAEIARSSAGNLTDYLNQNLSLDVRQRGRGGIQNDISMGGGSFEQVLLLVNGIPFNNPQTGHFNADIPIPLLAIDHLEIIEGSASRWLGPNAYSGAINIVTKQVQTAEIVADVSVGQHGYLQAETIAEVKQNAWSQLIGAGYGRSAGYVTNTDYNRWNSYLSTQYENEQVKLFMQAGAGAKSFGANAFYTPVYPDQFEEILSGFASAGWELGKQLQFRQELYTRMHLDAFHLFRHDAPEWYTGANRHMSQVHGLQNTLGWTNRIGHFNFGLDWQRESVYSTVLGEDMENPRPIPFDSSDQFYNHQGHRNHLSLYGEHLLHVGKIRMTSGVLGHWLSGHSAGFQLYPGFDLSYQVAQNIKLFTGINRSLRLPSFTELYYTTRTHNGNIELEPESAWTWQSGIRFSSQQWQTRISGFYAFSQNSIDWTRNTPEEKWMARNSQTMRRNGLTIQQIWYPRWSGFMSGIRFELGYRYVNLSQTDQDYDSKYLLDYLKHKVLVSSFVPIHKGLSVQLVGIWQDRAGFYINWDEDGEAFEQNYEPFLTVDLKLQYKWKGFTTYGSIENALNTTYADIGHVIQPGRWIRLGMRYNFSYL